MSIHQTITYLELCNINHHNNDDIIPQPLSTIQNIAISVFLGFDAGFKIQSNMNGFLYVGSNCSKMAPFSAQALKWLIFIVLL